MRPDDSLESVLLTESLCHIRPKLQPNPALARTAPILWLRIRPQHLHHQPTLTRLSLFVPVQLPDVVQCDVVVGEQATVQGEKFLTDQCGKRKCGEGFGEEFEDALVVLMPALAFEAVHPVHIVGFVIPAVQEEVFGIKPFVRVKSKGDFSRPRSSIYEIAVEKIAMRLGWVTVQSEDLQQIEELAMGITAHGELVVFFYLHLDHGCFIFHDILDRQYYLEHVFLMYLLPAVESLHHILNKFLRHLLLQTNAVIIFFHDYAINI